MLMSIISRMLDNGFRFTQAYKDEKTLRQGSSQYPQMVQTYLNLLSENYGVCIEQFEVYGEQGMSISLYKGDSEIDLSVFEKSLWEDKNASQTLNMKQKKLNKNMSKQQIGDFTIMDIKQKISGIENKKIRLIKTKNEVLEELNKPTIKQLINQFNVSEQSAQKDFQVALDMLDTLALESERILN